MRHFIFLASLTLLFAAPAAGLASPKPLSFPRAHNLRVANSSSLRAWLGIPELGGVPRPSVRIFHATNPDVYDTYSDIKSKDQGRIARRLNSAYGNPLDAEAKIGFSLPLGKFEQSFAVNAGVNLMVSDPVFPELSGILFNDYTASSSYRFALPHGVRLTPTLHYGLRRVMEKSFTIGQLLQEKPNVKIKTYPYRLAAELSVQAERDFRFGTLGAGVVALPLRQRQYDYWTTDLNYRSPDMLAGTAFRFPKRLFLWAGVAPVFGGAYNWARTLRAGASAAWFGFLRTDFFLFDNFIPGATIAARLGPVDLDFFTFERAEDEHRVFKSRQYGLSVSGKF